MEGLLALVSRPRSRGRAHRVRRRRRQRRAPAPTTATRPRPSTARRSASPRRTSPRRRRSPRSTPSTSRPRASTSTSRRPTASAPRCTRRSRRGEPRHDHRLHGQRGPLPRPESRPRRTDPDATYGCADRGPRADGLVALDYSPAEDQQRPRGARRRFADENNLTTISDLADVEGTSSWARSRTAGSGADCLLGYQTRQYYGLTFKDFTASSTGRRSPRPSRPARSRSRSTSDGGTEIASGNFVVLDGRQGPAVAGQHRPGAPLELADAYGDELAEAINELERAPHHRGPDRVERRDRHRQGRAGRRGRGRG